MPPAVIAGGRSLIGPAASGAQLLSHGERYRCLHFSCHVQFDPTWPIQSHLELADGPLNVTDTLHDLGLEADLVSLSACETGRSHILRGDELGGPAVSVRFGSHYFGDSDLTSYKWVAYGEGHLRGQTIPAKDKEVCIHCHSS